MKKRETFAKALSDILLRQKAVSAELARSMQDAFGRSSADEFDNFILQEGFVNREQLLAALSSYYNVPSVDVTGIFFDRLLLQNFPEDFLVRNAIIPLSEDENLLAVVASEPEREGLESEIRSFSNIDVMYHVGIARNIVDAVREYYDKAVTEVPEDQDLHEEHKEESDASVQILKEEGDTIEVTDDSDDSLTEEDDIR